MSLGRTDDVDAEMARAEPRRLLAEVALDGLPKRVGAKATSAMTEYVATYWPDLFRNWRPSTVKGNLYARTCYLQPLFENSRVTEIMRADAQRWRDGCIGSQETAFNRCRA